MKTLELNGEWRVYANGDVDGAIPAAVPGQVHLALRAVGKIPDPYYRDNEQAVAWVGEQAWTYVREFEVDKNLLDQETVVLRCEGLDTLATVRLNGEDLGSTDNMFREWEFVVKDRLRPGTNRLEVRFASTLPYIHERQEAHFLWHTGIGHHRIEGGNWVRKEQCNLGWDWGPMLPTCGIWRDIRLVGWTDGRLGRTRVEQQHGAGVVDLVFHTEVDLAAKVMKLRYVLSLEGETVGESMVDVGVPGKLTVAGPQLWWPNEMGAQPLYDLSVEMVGADERAVDRRSLRLGLRKLELIQEEDDWGRSFTFEVNGVRFFAKGANWIPADVFDGAISRDKLKDLLEGAKAAHMNMIRVWGGGKYECDAFYELCDELGLVVWQDFMFACSAYPAHEDAFLQNVEAEARQQVARLQHHACIGLWCGNNELEQIEPILGEDRAAGQMPWEDYRRLFDVLLAEVVGELDPGRPYWPSSEHSPDGDRTDSTNPNCGDAHLWAVWHGREPFEWYRTSFHRFCSEFGFQSFPHPATVRAFTEEGDRNITSYIMEHHQRSPIGNSAIMDYTLSWFRLPVGYENSVWISQIVQAYAMKYAVEHWRRNMPRCMGALYWQLNDCWPGPSWASIDYAHRWKALHYEAGRFFEPVHLSLLEDEAAGTVEVHLNNDRHQPREGAWRLVVTDIDGEVFEEFSGEAKMEPDSHALLATCDLRRAVEALGPRNLLAWGTWAEDGAIMSRNLATLVRPKHLELHDPEIAVEVLEAAAAGGEGKRARVRLSAGHPALFVWLEGADPDLRFSDNFFHLPAHEPIEIEACAEDLEGGVRVRSLWDTYQE